MMELFFPIAIGLIGFLTIIQVIPVKKAITFVIGICVLFLFLPILKSLGIHAFSGNYPWWAYIVGSLILLVILKMLLDRIYPWR